eukprot:scaffold3665_cov214-Amphora_coffeaeformis.AAC.1
MGHIIYAKKEPSPKMKGTGLLNGLGEGQKERWCHETSEYIGQPFPNEFFANDASSVQVETSEKSSVIC